MEQDQLSEVFDVVQVRGVLTGGIAASGSWISTGRLDDQIKFFAMLSGRAELLTDGLRTPIVLEAGDVGILNRRQWIELSGGPAGPRQHYEPDPDFRFAAVFGADRLGADVFVGGRIELNRAGEALLDALPPICHVHAAEASGLRHSIEQVFDELTGDRIGSAFAIRQYGQLLVLEMLRAYLDQAALPAGWLRLLADHSLRPALSLMHAEPGRPWSLPELARAASMSRTSFAERFRSVAGVPPLTYLNRWRMLLAQQALRSAETRIGPLASELGYASESAFSNAFKREVGMSPLRYRRGHQTATAVQ